VFRKQDLAALDIKPDMLKQSTQVINAVTAALDHLDLVV
jgi:hypothetical protein